MNKKCFWFVWKNARSTQRALKKVETTQRSLISREARIHPKNVLLGRNWSSAIFAEASRKHVKDQTVFRTNNWLCASPLSAQFEKFKKAQLAFSHQKKNNLFVQQIRNQKRAAFCKTLLLGAFIDFIYAYQKHFCAGLFQVVFSAS